ncbi:phosphotransferase family protein [Actinobacillus genomosp. 2]|uniref:phosphotransferase family protein n=1 Tax=Actinobacillus genomosp. 2 TaxID=230709 RepID=UPI0024418DF5|nr:phosphotransferase family protein [Actinobacillus genomosp. 2]WGE31218.1 phosphotransferase family protein [Actinobacillus genomosp. 2]
MNVFDWLARQQQAVVFRKNLSGLTACSQQIQLASGERFVLRQQNERATAFGISYTQEVQILRYLTHLPFTPKVYYHNENASLLTWVEGNIPSHFSSSLLSKLALQLAELHLFPITQPLPKLELAERCQFLWDKLSEQQQATLRFQPPFQTIQPFTLAICHHDLHLGNFIEKNDRLYLIDWEYSAVSDPALEIAMLFSANAKILNEQQQTKFLRLYLQATKFNQKGFKQKMAEYHSAINQLNQLWFAILEP